MGRKNKVKKPIYKRWWFIALVVLVILGAIGSGGDGDTAEEPDQEEPAVVEENDDPVEEPQEEESAISEEESEEIALNLIRENFEGVADVELIDKTFVFLPTDPNFSTELLSAYEGDPEALESWDNLVESMKSMSDSMEPTVPGYMIDLRNPENTENSILAVQDGVVIYNFIEEEENEEPAEEASNETVSQQNAVRSAKDYLDYTAFSRNGLIEQLEYEGFSTVDATYAVDNIKVDWMEQAVASAKDYIDYTPHSKQGLIEQLEYEGFTNEQATHGAENCGADWMEQAALSAQNYLDYTSFSRSGLIEQLEYEGFTNEQAVYGVDQTGL